MQRPRVALLLAGLGGATLRTETAAVAALTLALDAAGHLGEGA